MNERLSWAFKIKLTDYSKQGFLNELDEEIDYDLLK